MLTFNFSRIFAARGIDKPNQWLIEQGYSPNYAVKVVKSRFIRLDLPNLERLCISLNCTPNDLLAWKPGTKTKAGPDHPLYPLLRDAGKMLKLSQTINSLPIESLDEVQQAVESIREKKRTR